jgi:ATP-dependent Lon protease
MGDEQPLIVTADGIPVGSADGAIVPADEQPASLVLVPVRERVLFPGVTVPVVLPPGPPREAMKFAESQGPYAGVVLVKPGSTSGDKVKQDDLLDVVVLVRILRTVALPDQTQAVLLQGLSRARVARFLRKKPYFIAKVTYPPETFEETEQTQALWRAAKTALGELTETIPNLPDGFALAVANLDGPGELANFVGTYLDIKIQERIDLLRTFDIAARLRRALAILERELNLAKLAGKLREEMRAKVEKQQREFYLREQMRAIRKELGEEVDQRELALQELREAIAKRGLSETAQKKAEDELKRLEVLSPESPEYNVIRTYLDWLVGLPWQDQTEDNTDLTRAANILDEDHYGLEEVKERIVEFLAVRQLRPDQQGAILCLSGPPGVGKTSLGQSIARALGRKFIRFSLGGMRDEAEIKGHRRTYIGAMPGKILQELKRVEVRNPVFMLDEIDKLGSDWRGDPSSAMLEVLDPAQNSTFQDHYLDVPFDLSRVMFVCTANVRANIPAPLLDRMEVIELPGYTVDEKTHIASRYLVPRQREAHGLKTSHLRITRAAIPRIISGWTHEAGVRELERRVGRICRKVARRVAGGETAAKASVGIKELPSYLGPVRYDTKQVRSSPPAGVALGLAWTPVGGDVLFIEASAMVGRGALKLTGQIGNVMQESASIALSYVRRHAEAFGIDAGRFKEGDIHIHFPAGAIPKDGPSAGVTIVTALVSLLSGKKGKRVKGRLAMTGEMTLRGEVLPVGGIRDKVLAAQRAGVRTVILPASNERDVEEIPEHLVKEVEFVYAKTYEDVFQAAFA